MITQATACSQPPSGSTYSPIATACSSVLTLPPRLAGMTPCRITQNRSSVTPDLAGQHHHGDPPRQVAEHRQPDQRGADQRLVGDRVGQLAELGDESALAGDVAVDAVGDRRRPRTPPRPATRQPRRGRRAGEQGDHEHRHQHEAEHGERVGDVPGRHRLGGSPIGSSVSLGRARARGSGRVAAAPRGGSAASPRLARRRRRRGRRPRCRRTNAGDESAALAAPRRRPAGPRRRRPGPGGARPARRRRRSSTSSTSTSTRVPMRSSARWLASSSASALMRSTRSAITSASTLPSNADRVGALLVGVAEHADRVQPGGGQEPLELGDVVLGLAGEADDDVAARAEVRARAPRARSSRSRNALGAAEALHPAQHGRAGVLEGQVEVRRDAGRGRDEPRAGRAQLGRLQVGHPDPVDAVDRGRARGSSVSSARRSPRSLP